MKTNSLTYWILSAFIVLFQILLVLKPIAQTSRFSISNIGYETISICIVLLTAITLTKYSNSSIYTTLLGISVPTAIMLIPVILYLNIKNKILKMNTYTDDANTIITSLLNPFAKGNELLMVFHLTYMIQSIIFLFFIRTIQNIDPNSISFDRTNINLYIILASLISIIMVNINSWILYLFYNHSIENITDDMLTV